MSENKIQEASGPSIANANAGTSNPEIPSKGSDSIVPTSAAKIRNEDPASSGLDQRTPNLQ